MPEYNGGCDEDDKEHDDDANANSHECDIHIGICDIFPNLSHRGVKFTAMRTVKVALRASKCACTTL